MTRLLEGKVAVITGDGAWRIATLTLTRLRLDGECPADDPRASRNG